MSTTSADDALESARTWYPEDCQCRASQELPGWLGAAFHPAFTLDLEQCRVDGRGAFARQHAELSNAAPGSPGELQNNVPQLRANFALQKKSREAYAVLRFDISRPVPPADLVQ
jgi:hypothetical protein